LTSFSTFSRGYGYLNHVPGDFLDFIYSSSSYSYNFYTATQKYKKKKKNRECDYKPPKNKQLCGDAVWHIKLL